MILRILLLAGVCAPPVVCGAAGTTSSEQGKSLVLCDVIGYVTDVETGAAIVGATVQLADLQAKTDQDGMYLALVSPGDYTFTASAHGFVAQRVEITIEDLMTYLPFQLARDGGQIVWVPELVGLEQVAAAAAILDAGLAVGSVTMAYSATVPAGSVIGQTPVADRIACPGCYVDLVVSLGSQPGEGEGEGEGPVAAFLAGPTLGYAPLTVGFTDVSTGQPTWWAWDFDDDGTVDSTEQDPSHEYVEEGTYTVTLEVGNDSGMDSETRVGLVTALFWWDEGEGEGEGMACFAASSVSSAGGSHGGPSDPSLFLLVAVVLAFPRRGRFTPGRAVPEASKTLKKSPHLLPSFTQDNKRTTRHAERSEVSNSFLRDRIVRFFASLRMTVCLGLCVARMRTPIPSRPFGRKRKRVFSLKHGGVVTILLLACFLPAFPPIAGADKAGSENDTRVYVSNEGDDQFGDGTEASPWATIMHAMALAEEVADGSNPVIVHLAPGVYPERVVFAPYVTVSGADAATTIIEHYDEADDEHIVVTAAENTTIENCTITVPGIHQAPIVLVHIDNVAMRIANVVLDGVFN